MNDARVAKAYHEAAHTVVNVCHGYVDLSLSQTLDGRLRLSDREIIMSLCAGVVGEEICDYEGDTLSVDDFHGNRSLMKECLACAHLRIVGEEEDELAAPKWAREYGEGLLDEVRCALNEDRRKRAVHAIAEALLSKGRIDGAAAEQIVHNALHG